ncbi:hypothetical protein CIB48_g151 [Xylaria polymorpha]|nr:hypothetical protein CIB48_g151 [Xylaria polymorpha]
MPKPNETIAIVITLLVLAAFVGFYLLTMRLRDPSADYDDDDDDDDDDGDNDGDDTDSADLGAFAAQHEIPRPPPPAVHAFRGEPGLEGRGLATPTGSGFPG